MNIISSVKNFFSPFQQKELRSDPGVFTNALPQTNRNDILKNYRYLEQYHSWTYVAINFNSKNVSSVKPKLIEKKGENLTEIDYRDSNLGYDLLNFNEFTTFKQAMYLTSAHLSLTGTAYWIATESDNPKKRADFYILDPTRFNGYDVNKNGIPTHYRYQESTGTERIYPVEQLIIFKKPDPKNPVTGYGPLEASVYEHDTLELMQKWNRNFFENSARPEGFMVFKNKNRENLERINKQLRAYFGGNNTKKIGTLGEEFEWVRMMDSQSETDFIQGIDKMRDSILAIHGVYKALISDTANRATAEQATLNYQRYTLTPLIKNIEDTLNSQLIPKYFVDDNNIYFEYPDVIEEDRSALVDRAVKQWREGAIDRAKFNELMGYEINKEDQGIYIFDVNQRSQNLNKLNKSIQKINRNLKSLNNFRDEKEDRQKKRAFYNKKQIESERDYKSVIDTYFSQQLVRIVDLVDKSEKPNLSTRLDPESEKDIFFEILGDQIQTQAEKFDKIANEILRSYQGKTNKALDQETLSQLFDNLDFLVDEINEVTRKDIQSILAESIEEKRTKSETKQAIINKYNNYIDGTKNREVLEELDVYVGANQIGTDGKVVTNSTNRYNQMLENITNNLEGDDQRKALKALKGVTSNADDKIASTVDMTISSLYGEEAFEGISESRTNIIVRDQVQKIKSFVTKKNYENNEFVKTLEWLSASDSDVRTAHSLASGQKIKKGEKFRVGGELLEYPGDPSGSIENTINCRCTILPNVEIIDE